MRCLLSILVALLAAPLVAQIPLNPDFGRQLTRMGVRVNHPLDSPFRVLPTRENRFLEDHLAVYGKAEKLEIRFHLSPEDSTSRYYGMPHVQAGLLATNLGSNDEDAVTAVHAFGEEEMLVLNADWARMYTFRPKRSYSTKEQAQMIALYKEGRGMAYALLLFDKAPETLEGRQLILRFR